MNEIVNFTCIFVSGLFLNLFFLYFCNNLLDKKIRIKSVESWVIIIVITLLAMLFNDLFPQPYKIISTFLFLTFFIYFYFCKNIVHSLIMVILFEINVVLGELIFTVLTSSVVKQYNSDLMIIVSNIAVPAICFIILKTKIPKKVFDKIIEISETLRKKEVVIYSIMIIIIIIVSTMESYMKLPLQIVLTTNILMALGFIGIIIKLATTKGNLQIISNKYQTSINSLKEYELMIDKFRINNHENKNQLLTIRNMTKDKKTVNYIDKLVDNKINDNEKIMHKTSKIPEGGLRATIYSKICLMDKYKIKYNLDVAKDVRTVDLINMNENLMIDVCKILGVFLDNAIEAVKKGKNKLVRIEIYIMDKELCVDISNNFKGNIDFNKLGNSKYTTKGENHGYGLMLVNKILSENSNDLKNEMNINGNVFTQTLKIKM